MKDRILIAGAGAIGRGYLPWVFDLNRTEFFFIDSQKSIVDLLNKNNVFTSYCVKNNNLEKRSVPVAGAYTPEQFREANISKEFTGIFVNVGPRNVAKVCEFLMNTNGPIILCENDPVGVDQAKAILGRKDVFFAVPDVITSNTAPENLLKEDPLSIISEEGILFIEEGASEASKKKLQGTFSFCSREELLQKQWTAKLYLHNTPHCVAAYLGALVGVRYVHEAMAIEAIAKIVEGSMVEMLNSLKLRWDIPHEFLDWYAQKELARFRCQLLYDPISRVAREPLRKLELEGRLIGAAQICLSLGFIPQNILIGMGAALLFSNPTDPDRHLAFMRRALSPDALLTHVLSLRKGEALERVLEERLASIIARLEELTAKETLR